METTRPISDLIQGALQPGRTTRLCAPTGWKPHLDDYDPSLKAAKAACAGFVADMEANAEPYWLTLLGVTGCGKSFLMGQVFREATRINPGNPKNNPIWPPDWDDNQAHVYTGRRPYALRYDEGGLASRMRNGQYDLPRELRDEFFVCLDEVGIVRDPTNFISEAVGTLCEARLGRWTMFASNFSLQEISDRMDDRIASRMLRNGNKVVVITAGDYALHA